MAPEFYVKKQSSVLATTKCLTHYTLNIAPISTDESITVIGTFGKERLKSLQVEKEKVTSGFPNMATAFKTNMFYQLH